MVYSYVKMSDEERIRRKANQFKYLQSEKGKEARARYNKKYAEEHREEVNSYMREYYWKNHDKIREQRKKRARKKAL